MNTKLNSFILHIKYAAMIAVAAYSVTGLRQNTPFSLVSVDVASKMIIAALQIIFIPGYLVFNLFQLNRRENTDLLELVAFSLGIGIILLELLCILTVEAQLNSIFAAYAIIAVSLVLIIVNYVKELDSNIDYLAICKKFITRHDFLLYFMVISAIIITSILLYKIESPVISGEDQLHVAVIRKLLENNVINKQNITYKYGTTHTYLYPGLHFMFALFSRISDIDSIIIYAKMRFILGGLSLILLWVFSKTLFKSKYISFAIFLTCLSLIYNGMAARLPGFYCGQLIPVSHISDIAMAIFLPLVLIFTFKYIESQGFINRFLILSILLCLASLVIHTRESIQVIFYYAATLIGYILFNRRDKTIIYKILLVTISIIIIGVLYKHIHSLNVHDVKTLEEACHQKAIRVLYDISRNFNTALANPGENPDVKYFVPAGKLIFKKYVSLALPLALLLLAMFRKKFFGIFLGASILGALVVMRFNILSMFMVVLTYSEILFTPGRFILYFSYILFGFSIFCLSSIILETLLRIRKRFLLTLPVFWGISACIFVFMFSSGILLPAINLLQLGLYYHSNIIVGFLLMFIFIFMSIKPLRKKIDSFSNKILSFKPNSVVFWVACLFSIILPIYMFGGHEDERIFDVPNRYETTNIFVDYKTRALQPDITNFRDYALKTQILHLPFDLVDFIRTQIPPGNVFAFNVHRGNEPIFIPFFANQYLAAAPNDLTFLWIRNSDDAYLNTFKGNRQIIFNFDESVSEKLKLIGKFNFSYILVDPEFQHLNNFFQLHRCFKKVYDKNDYSIYEIDIQQLNKILRDLGKEPHA